MNEYADAEPQADDAVLILNIQINKGNPFHILSDFSSISSYLLSMIGLNAPSLRKVIFKKQF